MADDQGAERKDAEGRTLAPPGATETTETGSSDASSAPGLPHGTPTSANPAGDGEADLDAETAGIEPKAEPEAAEPEAKAGPEVAEPEASDPETKPEPPAVSAAASAASAASAPSPKPTPVRRRASRLWWALPILMLVEFYVYGHNGRLEICVGKEGDTDFALVGQERTDANRWKFPRCETRENLGLRSQYDAKVTEGIEAACRGATIFRHQGEAKACAAGEQGWQHRVQGHFVPPWDPAYYRHLFWFLQ
jgi:hypothetical protein